MTETFPYGAVLKLTRADTPETIRAALTKMKENGFTAVVIWPAACYWEERTEDYPFRTGKVVLRLAEEIGLSIVMELAGQISVHEYIPDSEMKPEYYATDQNGNVIYGQTSFGFLNYFHPEVDAAIRAHYRRVALAYRDYPALLGYDVFNETMFRSHDPYTMAEFRRWLQEKYGTLEELNRAWDRTYSDWEQVDHQHWMWLSILPESDYAAFRKAAIGRFLSRWCDAIREVDPNRPLIADNIGSMISPGGNWPYERPQDDFSLQETVDILGMSAYEKGAAVSAPVRRWQKFAGHFAASRRRGFWISELQTHFGCITNPRSAVRPNELRMWALEALSGGASGLIYWMWRPFISGLQIGGRGLVDTCGEDTDRLAAAAKIAGFVSRVGAVIPERSDVALLYDPNNEDFSRAIAAGRGGDTTQYLSALYGAYAACFDLGRHADVVRADDASGYRVLIVSEQLAADEKTCRMLDAFLRDGGTVIADGKIGLCDDRAVMLDALPFGKLNGAFGITYSDTDYEPLDFSHDGETVHGYFGREVYLENGARVICRFADGSPAVWENRVGKGKVVTIATHLFYGYGKTAEPSVLPFLRSILDEIGVRGNSEYLPVRVRFARNAEGRRIAFAFNYTETEQTVALGGKKFALAVGGSIAVDAENGEVLC